MFYGATIWDPVLIIAQIVAIQCLFYVSLGLLLWVLLGPYVVRLNMQHFFDWRMMSFQTFPGWMIVVANLVNGLVGAIYLVFIVERAKKCLDFAATAYIIHFIIVLVFSGFPSNFEWWVINVIALAAMAMLGEWLCLQCELREIPIGSLRSRSTSGVAGPSSDRSKGVGTSTAVGKSGGPSQRSAMVSNNV